MTTVVGVRPGRRVAVRGWTRPRIRPLDVISVVWLVVLLAFSLIPMVWMLSTSLKGQFAALAQPPEWIPSQPMRAVANRRGSLFWIRFMAFERLS